jgi:hypothetical protein
MKLILIIAAFLATVSFSCKDRSAGQTNVVTSSSDTVDSTAIIDSNSRVNLADSATNMLNKAEDKMEEAADKTKDAVNK